MHYAKIAFMINKKFLCSGLLFVLFAFSLFAQSNKDTQLIQSGHWIYNDLYVVSSEAKKSYFIDNQPLTIGEIKFYFSEVEYEALSPSGKKLYEKISSFLNKDENLIKTPAARIFINPKINTELYYKSNPDIDYTFGYAIKDRFLTVPILLGFSNYITVETDPFLGKNYNKSQAPDNYSNIPYAFDQFDVYIPRFAYAATGYTGKNWGINLHVAKEGLTIGNSILGSLIYNKTFETDFYTQINAYTKVFKYSMDVIQVQTSKYFFLHQLNVRPFSNFKIGIIEGSLLNAPFELRYLNPLYFMHSFISWQDYHSALTNDELKYYHEGHFGAYLCFTAEYMPVSNLRIYGYFAQNEILDFGWEHSQLDLSYPDSIGFQLGAEHVTLFDNFSLLKNTIEGIYTSPFLYIKQSPDWSYWRTRIEEISGKKVSSWMGSPFGPDCFAVQYKAEFQSINKYTIGFGYLFKMHGENSSNMFVKSKPRNAEDKETEIYIYYPYAQYIDAQTDEERDAAVRRSRYMWMTGTVEYTNQFTLTAQYNIFDNLMVYTESAFTFVFNNNNIQNNFASDFQIGIGCEYKLF